MDATIRKSLWNHAGTAGLLLGLVSTASMFIGQFINTLEMSPFMTSISGFLLWGLETGFCIYFMLVYMRKFSLTCPSATNSETFRMGMATALLSALIYSAAVFANIAFISADLFAEQYETTLQQMSSMLDSNSLNMMDKLMNNLPQISFFSNLIYCFLFGTIVSAVLSRNIPAKDPFADYRPDEQ